MISLEQVKLLESKVTRIIDHVKQVDEENTVLKKNLDSYQKRIEELEVLVQQFKEEQSRIEDGILSALDRLNKFEDALESTLTGGGKLPSLSGDTKEAPVADNEPEAETQQDQSSPSAPDREELDIF